MDDRITKRCVLKNDRIDRVLITVAPRTKSYFQRFERVAYCAYRLSFSRGFSNGFFFIISLDEQTARLFFIPLPVVLFRAVLYDLSCTGPVLTTALIFFCVFLSLPVT